MKRTKLIMAIVASMAILAGCGNQSVANTDIVARIEKAESPVIYWGVKADTNLFGFYNVKDAEIQGFDIDIANALTEEMTDGKATAKVVEVTSKTRIPLVKNGNIDAIIATMTINDERKKVVDFSEVYFDAGQSLLVPEDSSINSLEDIGTKTILAVKGSTSAQNIREHAPEANVLELENYAECFTALVSGQGVAMTTDNAILLGIIANNPGYRLAGGNFTNEPYGIAVNKGQEVFLNEMNAALEEIKANGTYDEIYNKWFGELINKEG